VLTKSIRAFSSNIRRVPSRCAGYDCPDIAGGRAVGLGFVIVPERGLSGKSIGQRHLSMLGEEFDFVSRRAQLATAEAPLDTHLPIDAFIAEFLHCAWNSVPRIANFYIDALVFFLSVTLHSPDSRLDAFERFSHYVGTRDLGTFSLGEMRSLVASRIHRSRSSGRMRYRYRPPRNCMGRRTMDCIRPTNGRSIHR
jgi:hypothetical protein